MASLAADRFQQLNGIPAYVLTDHVVQFDQLRSPQWVKAFVWEFVGDEVERIIWFDADVVPIHPLGDLPDASFAAVLDMPATTGVDPFIYEGEAFRPYFNSGFFIAGRESEPVFRQLAQDMVCQSDHDRFEQSWFNVRVRELLGGFTQLPLTWNWFFQFYDHMIGRPDEDIRMLHFIATLGDGRWDAVRACYRLLEGSDPDNEKLNADAS